MSSITARRCQHIKVNGTRCGSPALRQNKSCFYHHQNHPATVLCYDDTKHAIGKINLPVFEDAYSIQTVIREVVQLVLQKRVEPKTASLLLYALQIASSNLKRMELEKPQPAEVVTDLESVSSEPTNHEPTNHEPTTHDQKATQANASPETSQDAISSGEDLPPGTIQACHRPEPRRGVAKTHAAKRIGAMLETLAARTPSQPRVT
jgi:hypothetical protein